MKYWKSITLGLLVSACLTEGKFGKFDQAEVISFSVQQEVTPSVVSTDDRHILVTVGADDDLSKTTLSSLVVSSLASSPLKPGDELDLSDNYDLVVTAEDGSKATWIVEGTHLGSGSSGGASAGGGDGEGGLGGEGSEGSCPSYLATYVLTGLFELTDTPLGAGNGSFTVGPGELTLRVIPTGPGSATTRLVAYDMPQDFTVLAPGATTVTATRATAGPDPCGLAQGTLQGATLTWETCDYGPAPPLGTTNWSTDDIVGGPGCIHNYSVTGEITCTGAFCATSGVDFPISVNDLYPQPLNAFEFSADLQTFAMRSLGAPPSGAGRNGVEIPSTEPSRNWIGLNGTLKSYECQELPNCN